MHVDLEFERACSAPLTRPLLGICCSVLVAVVAAAHVDFYRMVPDEANCSAAALQHALRWHGAGDARAELFDMHDNAVDFHRCRQRVSAYAIPPYCILRPAPGAARQDDVTIAESSVNYRYLELLAARWNFTYSLRRDIAGTLTPGGNATGAIGDLMSGRADVILGVVLLTVVRSKYLDMGNRFISVCQAWAYAAQPHHRG